MSGSALARAILPFVLGAFVTVAGIAIYVWRYEGDATITTASSFIGFRRMDKLFTSFAHVPVIQITRSVSAGDAARGMVKEIFGQAEVPDLVVQGICFREYEVGLGYADTLELFPEHLETACSRRDEELPEPVILASNPVAGRVYGSYSQVECDREEMGRGSERPSWTLIKNQLERDRQWPRIVERSQRVLGSFLRIYCRDEADS